MTWSDYAILFIGSLLIAMGAAFWGAHAEGCGGWPQPTCNGTAWSLELNDDVLLDELTEEECQDEGRALEPQIPPFTQLVCVEYDIAEQEL
jgi:hypothetical protein